MTSKRFAYLPVFLQLLLSGAIGSSLFYYFFGLLPAKVATPSVSVAFFFLPIVPIIVLIQNSGELLKSNEMTKEEHRRFSQRVKDIQSYMKAVAIILVLSGIGTGFSLYFAELGLFNLRLVMSVVGGLIGFEILAVIKLLNYRVALHEHQARVEQRFNELKQKRKRLLAMKNKKDEEKS
ncbi:hypothetical protein [Vibrio sp. L85]|uniref:hypothetical protein n=1 Tax=Vibrio sp. L85 TaxID=1769292 RepID=UPI0009A43B9D|nr:hypothetical protein [Vibrio sp. L85]